MRNNLLLKIVIAIVFLLLLVLLIAAGVSIFHVEDGRMMLAQRVTIWIAACLLWGYFLRMAIRRYYSEM